MKFAKFELFGRSGDVWVNPEQVLYVESEHGPAARISFGANDAISVVGEAKDVVATLEDAWLGYPEPSEQTALTAKRIDDALAKAYGRDK